MKENLKIGNFLYEKIKYEKVLWIGGFIKTTLASALIGTGVVFLLNGLIKHPYLIKNQNISLIIGLGSIIVGMIIVFVIDCYRKLYKKQELTILSKEFEKRCKENIDIKAQEIAEQKIMEKLKKL